jgi:Zn-dependent M28 family amino/carboxypeptidase
VVFNFRDVLAYGAEHSTLGILVARAAALMDLQVTPDPAPVQSYFVRSDQYSFVRHGIPAVYVPGGMKPVDSTLNALALPMQLGTRYHQRNDDMNSSFDFDAGAKNARFNFLLG